MLLSADYPYYRDDPAHWEHRLRRLQTMGIPVVTCYVPWRHHQPRPDMAPDFDGRTQPNRDVRGFLTLCQALGLEVILKPGPFVHAELNYGGLPDWVCPLFAPIEPIRDHAAALRTWSGAALDVHGAVAAWPLPAPFDPTFLAHVQTWMAAVREAVLAPFAAPAGPIVAVQIGNEGLYSDGQAAPWAYDYSPTGLAQFRRFLQAKYGDPAALAQAHGRPYADWADAPAPQLPADDLLACCPQALVDWGEFQAWYLAEVFRTWAAPLATDLPILVNQNPPLDAPYGLDAWLTRVEPERWHGLTYGFTNWVGDVSARPSAFDRYALVARRYPGVNLEENWGFAALYDAAYADASTSFYQTLLILNAGARGFNIYTGVATGGYDPNLTVLPQTPYPDCAPITAEGGWTPKAENVRWLAAFFRRYGQEFLEAAPRQDLAWAFSSAVARLDVWKPAHQPRHGAFLAGFMQAARRTHRDYALVNLDAAVAEALARYRQVYGAAPDGLPPAAQATLADYLARGGEVVWVGPLPATAQSLAAAGRFRVQATAAVEADPDLAVEGEADVWVRSHSGRDLHFVTVLPAIGQRKAVRVYLRLNGRPHELTVQAAAAGGALLRIAEGHIAACLVKGHNGFLGHSVTPAVALDGQGCAGDGPGDLAHIAGQRFFLPAEAP